jgi:hypothetical protein
MHADFSVELGRDDAALELPWSSADPAVRFYDLKKHPELVEQIPEAMAYPELGAFVARINDADFPMATAKCDAWASREVAPEEEVFGDRKFVSYIDLVFEDKAARCSFVRHESFARELCRLLNHAPEIPAAVEVVIRRCYYHGEGSVCEAVGESEVENETEAGDKAETGNEAEAKEKAEVGDKGGEKNVGVRQNVAEKLKAEGGHDKSDWTAQLAAIGHTTEYEGNVNAVERSEVDLEEAKAAGRLDETAADERVGLSSPRGSFSGFCITAYVTGFGDSDHEPRRRWQIALALFQNALVQLAKKRMGETVTMPNQREFGKR